MGQRQWLLEGDIVEAESSKADLRYVWWKARVQKIEDNNVLVEFLMNDDDNGEKKGCELHVPRKDRVQKNQLRPVSHPGKNMCLQSYWDGVHVEVKIHNGWWVGQVTTGPVSARLQEMQQVRVFLFNGQREDYFHSSKLRFSLDYLDDQGWGPCKNQPFGPFVKQRLEENKKTKLIKQGIDKGHSNVKALTSVSCDYFNSQPLKMLELSKPTSQKSKPGRKAKSCHDIKRKRSQSDEEDDEGCDSDFNPKSSVIKSSKNRYKRGKLRFTQSPSSSNTESLHVDDIPVSPTNSSRKAKFIKEKIVAIHSNNAENLNSVSKIDILRIKKVNISPSSNEAASNSRLMKLRSPGTDSLPAPRFSMENSSDVGMFLSHWTAMLSDVMGFQIGTRAPSLSEQQRLHHFTYQAIVLAFHLKGEIKDNIIDQLREHFKIDDTMHKAIFKKLGIS